MSERFIKIESAKGLNCPVVTNIPVNAEKIYWNIRFNIPLNPISVSDESMDVTDVTGYILTSEITYNEASNSIVITPREPYKPDATYILNITTNVRSKGNNPLKEAAQVIFTLKGSEICDFKVLKGQERLKIDIKPSKHAPTASQLRKVKLPTVGFHVNFWAGVGALMLFFVAVITQIFILIIIATALLLAGIAHIIYQFFNHRAASTRAYNKGARLYNDEFYYDASQFFDLAISLDPENKFAERAKKRLAGIV